MKLFDFIPNISDMEWSLSQYFTGQDGPCGVEAMICNSVEWGDNMDVTKARVRRIFFPRLTLLGGNFTNTNTWTDTITFEQGVEITGNYSGVVEPTFLQSATIGGNYTLSGTFASLDSMPTSVVGDISITSSSMATINLAGLAEVTDGATWTFSGALTEAAVDAVLARFVELTNDLSLTSGILNLNGGTNAAPSLAGEADKTTLEAAGLTVNTTP